jgi:hypothetical protein
MQHGEQEFDTWLTLAVKQAIDNNSVADSPPKFSWRVKPSSLGDECVARQWYAFKWVKHIQKPGQIVRLLERGNSEEKRLITSMRRDGWLIDDEDTERGDKFNRQYKIEAINGHLKGFIDAKAAHPVYTNNEKILLELKTYNTKRFCLLVAKGVKETDISYYTQVCIYMRELNLPWCLFAAINKNDDDLYFEVVNRDDETAQKAMTTAATIVATKARPARFSETRSHHVCKYCDYVGICHFNEPVAINCRSCLHCDAIENGEFYCSNWKTKIPNEDAILVACSSHNPVK